MQITSCSTSSTPVRRRVAFSLPVAIGWRVALLFLAIGTCVLQDLSPLKVLFISACSAVFILLHRPMKLHIVAAVIFLALFMTTVSILAQSQFATVARLINLAGGRVGFELTRENLYIYYVAFEVPNEGSILGTLASTNVLESHVAVGMNSSNYFIYSCHISPYAIPILCVIFLAVCFVPSAYSGLQAYRRRARGRCEHCGYNLAMLTSSACPECGCATKSLGKAESEVGR